MILSKPTLWNSCKMFVIKIIEHNKEKKQYEDLLIELSLFILAANSCPKK